MRNLHLYLYSFQADHQRCEWAGYPGEGKVDLSSQGSPESNTFVAGQTFLDSSPEHRAKNQHGYRVTLSPHKYS